MSIENSQILIVDNDPDFHKMLKFGFELNDIPPQFIHTATNKEEAKRIIKDPANHIGRISIDADLGIEDGIELVEELIRGELGRHGADRIIIFSNDTLSISRSRSLGVEFVDKLKDGPLKAVESLLAHFDESSAA